MLKHIWNVFTITLIVWAALFTYVMFLPEMFPAEFGGPGGSKFWIIFAFFAGVIPIGTPILTGSFYGLFIWLRNKYSK